MFPLWVSMVLALRFNLAAISIVPKPFPIREKTWNSLSESLWTEGGQYVVGRFLLHAVPMGGEGPLGVKALVVHREDHYQDGIIERHKRSSSAALR
jgi:hypothetical protein